MKKISHKEQYGYERDKYLGYYNFQKERLEPIGEIDYFDPEAEDED